MPKPRKKNFTKRTTPNLSELSVGLQGAGRAFDFFRNMGARTGFGTPNLMETTEYPLVRFTYDYWSLISLFEGHWLCRRIVEGPAQDMVRTWPVIVSDMDPKDDVLITRAIRRMGVKRAFLTAKTWANLFGGAGCLMVIDGHEDRLDEPLELDDIAPHSFRGLLPFDRWAGISPVGGAYTKFDNPHMFNKPEKYQVRAVGGDSYEIHASRILRFTGPENPTPEREAYSWWGISELEPCIEEIKKYDNMNNNVANLTFRANILGMKYPDLAQLISGLGSNAQATAKWEQRISEINHLISNQSMIPLPADGELSAVQYSFSGLAEVMMQQMLVISAAARQPVARLWGRTYSGLGQTGDGDEMIYEERIATDNEVQMLPQHEQLYPVICMSELGEVPDDIDLVYPSVRVLDEKAKTELAKTVVDTVTVALNSGGISKRQYAQELKASSKKTDIFSSITDEFIATLPDTVQNEDEFGADLFGEEGAGDPQLDPASGPQKVLREESKMNKTGAKTKAADSVPKDLRPGQEVNVHGKWLTVEKVQPAKDLFGVPVLHVKYKTGEVVPYPVDAQIKVKVKDTTPLPAIVRAADADGAGPERTVQGLRCVIENKKGSTRSGKGWSQVLPYHYGYLKGVPGADGDSLDVMIGDNPQPSHWAYVFDQRSLDRPHTFDEHKCFLGFPSAAAAMEAYMAGHHRAKDVFMDWTPMPIDEFKQWIQTHDMKTPCGDTAP